MRKTPASLRSDGPLAPISEPGGRNRAKSLAELSEIRNPEPQADLGQPYHQAVYAPDVTLAGYGEVPALVDFLHQKALSLGFPGREMEVLGIGGEGTSLVYFRLPEP
jgi:hypothetical protein